MANDEAPSTPQQALDLLEWVRRERNVPEPKDIEFRTSMGHPDYLILGYLTEECGIEPRVVREQLVAMNWTEALAVFDHAWKVAP